MPEPKPLRSRDLALLALAAIALAANELYTLYDAHKPITIPAISAAVLFGMGMMILAIVLRGRFPKPTGTLYFSGMFYYFSGHSIFRGIFLYDELLEFAIPMGEPGGTGGGTGTA